MAQPTNNTIARKLLPCVGGAAIARVWVVGREAPVEGKVVEVGQDCVLLGGGGDHVVALGQITHFQVRT